jgi:hypothetical protein
MTTEDPLVQAVTTTFKTNPIILKLGGVIQTFPFLVYLVGLVIKVLPIIGGKTYKKGIEVRNLPPTYHE